MISHFKPVRNRRGELELFDIWIDGEWHGSRRTRDYCTAYLNQVSKKALTNGDTSRTIDPSRA